MEPEQALALVLATGALALGPVLYGLLGRALWARSLLDGFVLGSVGGLVVLHVLPRVVEVAAVWAIAAFAVGVVLPFALHRAAFEGTERWAVALGLAAVAGHAAMDGAGIARGEEALSAAIVLHRVPASVLVWWLMKPRFGARAATFGLVLLGVATFVGFFGMARVDLPPLALATFEALVGGALLHVVAGHGNLAESRESRGRIAGALVGALAGLAVPVALLLEQSHGVAG